MSSSSDEHTSVPSDSRKGAWTAKEDQCLQARVSKYGTKSWTTIASGVEGRSAKSCRLRWYNQLCPGVKRTPFSEWEQAVIIKAQKEHTNKWAALAKLLKGRTDNAIKNHWNATLSRKLNNPAENFRNQYIERNVSLEWLLQHPELDSSNDIEDALAGTFKSGKLGLGVIKPIKKKKRRSTPSSPSYSLSPSPPPPSRTKSLRNAALEACCESGLSSETAPAASKRAAAAAADAAAGASGSGSLRNQQQQQQQQQQQMFGGAAGGQQQSGCYSPCSQTHSPPAMHTQQQQQLGMHCSSCIPGPGGMCSCGVWMGPPPQQQQKQQQQHYHSSNGGVLERTTTASSYLSCQDGQLSSMVWEQQPPQQQQQFGGEFGNSSYGGAPQDFHGSNFQAMPMQQQQQQQQLFVKPEPQYSNPMQDAMLHSPVKHEESQQPSLLTPEAQQQQQQQQQHSSSSMSSGSPVGVSPVGVPEKSHSSTDLPSAAAAAAAAAGNNAGSSGCAAASGLRLHTSNPGNACSSLLAGLPPASSRTAVAVAAAAGGLEPQALPSSACAVPNGAWMSNVSLAGGLSLPPSDCLGPLGIRPLGQGKILSPAAYDMMMAGVSRPNVEVQLRAENGSAVHAAAAGELGAASCTALQQHHSVPPPLPASMMSAVPSMMAANTNNNGSSSRGVSPRTALGRSHSYTFGPSCYDSSSAGGGYNGLSAGPPVHFSSAGGCYPGSEYPQQQQQQHNDPSSSSRGGHSSYPTSAYGCEPSGQFSSGLGPFSGLGPAALGSGSMGPGAAAYAASNAACARPGGYSSLADLPPVSRCHSTPAPFNGGSSSGGYPPAPWQQQQQQQFGLPPRSSYPANSYEHVPYGSNPSCYNSSSSGGLPPRGGRHMHGSQSFGGSNPNTYSSADALSSLPASLLADAPATVMLQQAAAAAGASSAAAAMGELPNIGLPLGLIKDLSAAGPHYQQQQQHLVHAHTAPALSSLAAQSGSEHHHQQQQQQQQQRSATPPLAGWDAVGETLSTAFGEAGDDGLVWDNFDLPDLKENDVEALLML